MKEQKLCLSLNGTFGIPDTEQVRLLKRTGFEAFTGCWCVGKDDRVRDCAKVGKEEGMIFQSFHAPWSYTADMWDENEREDAAQGVKDLKHFIDLCSELEIPIMISHVFVGFDKVCVPSDFGIENYGAVIEHAKKSGVKIAFENTEGEQGLDALLTAFRSEDCVGFCWDSGHEMCYNDSKDLLALYGDKLIATHINDNLGVRDFNGVCTWKDDLHLLPFDGIGDWEYNAQRIVKTGFKDILTFELNNKSKPDRHENDKYFKMPIEEYVAEAYVRACRFASMIKKIRNA
ncbi:MAG: sugar phosphate isomerase/epimerase [Clostridia bacterium]|nr:sugar phosphate isomerase/epimerase [Clostridia bacterium]